MKRAIKSIALFSIGILTTWLIFWYGVGNTTGFSFTNIFRKIFLTPDWQTASKATIVLDGQSGKVGIGTANPTERLDVNGNVKVDWVVKVNKICDINGRNCRDIKSLGSNSNQIVSVCNISNVGKINKNGQVCKCYPKYIRVTNDSHCINAKKDGKNWYSNWTKYKCANWYIYKRKRRWFWHYRSRQKYVGFKNIFKNYNCWFDKFLNINVIGKIWTNGFSATSWYPKGWWWGIHTWDVYAEWTVWVGSRWQVAASMDRYGTIKGKRLCLNGKCITSVCFYINDYKLYKSFGAVNGNKSLTLPSVSSVKVEFFSDDLKGNVKFFDRYGNLIKTVNCWRWRDWDDALQYCRAEVSWVKYIKRNMRDEWWRSPVGLKVYTRQQICLR